MNKFEQLLLERAALQNKSHDHRVAMTSYCQLLQRPLNFIDKGVSLYRAIKQYSSLGTLMFATILPKYSRGKAIYLVVSFLIKSMMSASKNKALKSD